MQQVARKSRVLDLERMLTRCYTFSIKGRQQIVYEELIWNTRLSEFRDTLQCLNLMLEAKIEVFEHCKELFKSLRLKNLCTLKPIDMQSEDELRSDLEDPSGLFSNYTSILTPFIDSIEWEKVENGKFMPRP